MIEYDFQVLLHVLRGLASRLIMAANHIDCRAQPGARCGFAHQGDHGVKRVEQQALARSRDMRKETTLSMSKSAARCCPLFGTQEVKASLSHTGGPVFSMIMDSSWGTNGVPSLFS